MANRKTLEHGEAWNSIFDSRRQLGKIWWFADPDRFGIPIDGFETRRSFWNDLERFETIWNHSESFGMISRDDFDTKRSRESHLSPSRLPPKWPNSEKSISKSVSNFWILKIKQSKRNDFIMLISSCSSTRWALRGLFGREVWRATDSAAQVNCIIDRRLHSRFWNSINLNASGEVVKVCGGQEREISGGNHASVTEVQTKSERIVCATLASNLYIERN